MFVCASVSKRLSQGDGEPEVSPVNACSTFQRPCKLQGNLGALNPADKPEHLLKAVVQDRLVVDFAQHVLELYPS